MPSATWKVHTNPAHLYFVTTRAIRGRHVFHRDVTKRILIDSLHIGRLLGHYRLYAFVVMPNHLHCIVQPEAEHSLADVVRDLKKGSSGLVIRHFEAEGNESALLNCADGAGNQRHRAVWESEYQAQSIYTPDFLRQKLTYLHNNPLQPQWQLAETASAYPWSSARCYLAGLRSIIPVDDVRELLA